MKKLGICVVAWNRPKYLKQTLESLKANDLTDTKVYLFQDGHTCKFTGTQLTPSKTIEKSVETFREIFPKGAIHLQKENVSVAINQYDALTLMAQAHEQFIFLEDDVLLSPHYIQLMRILDKQFADDDRIASISPSFRAYCERKEWQDNEDKLILENGHIWAELYWSDKLRKVLDIYLSYYSMVKDKPYKARPHGQIRQLFEDSKFSYAKVTSQDMGKDWAVYMTGMKRARMKVNRATGIGDVGFHSTPQKMKRLMDGHNEVYVSDTELKIKEFELCKTM